LSSLFTNPAGLGAYRRRNIEISFGLNEAMTKSTYMGNMDEASRARFNINTIGIVGHQKIDNSDWKSVSFGFAHGKTNNFYQNINISGVAINTTMMDQFAAQAAGIHPDDLTNTLPFTSGLAYQTYAIDPTDSIGSSYYANSYTGDIQQSKRIQRTGVQSETSFGVGANYNDFLLLGMTLNFNSVRFRDISTYKESFENDPGNVLSKFSYNENLYSTGTGIGVKLGAIVIPTSWVRIGAAYHSPYRTSFTESYTADMTSLERVGLDWDYTSPTLVTEYIVRTPARYMANAAFVLGKMGVFSVDYEYANYERIRMFGTRSNSYNYSYENETIGQIYRGTHRLRAGMEFRAMEVLYLRGGVVYQQSPFINGVGAITTPRMTYTGGIGYRSDNFFVDLAAAYTSGFSCRLYKR